MEFIIVSYNYIMQDRSVIEMIWQLKAGFVRNTDITIAAKTKRKTKPKHVLIG